MPFDQIHHGSGDANPAPVTAERLAFALMDRIECGIAAVGVGGKLWHANRAARREFAQGGVLRLEGAVLNCLSSHQNDWLALLNDAAVRHRSRLAWFGDGETRQMITAMPMPVEGLGTPLALVMLGRRCICSPLGIEMLAARHGLTHTERRVLSLLVQNLGATEIAARHGVGMATVRSQIMSIRHKLQVRSIDALLLRVAEVPPVMALH